MPMAGTGSGASIGTRQQGRHATAGTRSSAASAGTMGDFGFLPREDGETVDFPPLCL